MSASTATSPSVTSSASPSVASSAGGPERKARRRSAALGVVAWVVGIGFCLPALWMVLTS
ncbi:sorbitol/mannitol transport system permease protein, partial [Streptomyces sp. Termitarium-T10T-6]